MTTTQVILAILAVLALIAVAVLAVAVGKRNAQRRRHAAEQLRSDAARQSPAVAESLRIAEESGARARLAHLEAERAKEEAQLAATEAQRVKEEADRARVAALMDQARQEDSLHEADLIDPDRGSDLDGPEGEARFGLQRPDTQSGAA